jgi:polar amino acid transport system substrate-binding protein
MLTLNFFKQTLVAVTLLAALGGASAAETLRVCADPDNLPFSKMDGPDKGLYVELAEKVGARMGVQVEYVWWLTYNQRKALRNTIMQDGCDAYFALPADTDYRVRGVNKTQSFLKLSYALVAPKGTQISGLNDLKTKRVGVVYGTPTHILLASREGFQYSSFRQHEEVFAALNKGEVDVALVWGPLAGYENIHSQQSRWQLISVSGDGLEGQVAVGVPNAKADLQARISKALTELQPEIAALAAKYGFPSDKPVAFAKTSLPEQPVKVAKAPAPRTGFIKVANPADVVVAQAAPDLDYGKTTFNNTCSHCHGSNGASPVSERDLRKLRSRYKESWEQTALTTIQNGRSDAGMPTWKAAFNEDQIKSIIAFLATVQK